MAHLTSVVWFTRANWFAGHLAPAWIPQQFLRCCSDWPLFFVETLVEANPADGESPEAGMDIVSGVCFL